MVRMQAKVHRSGCTYIWTSNQEFAGFSRDNETFLTPSHAKAKLCNALGRADNDAQCSDDRRTGFGHVDNDKQALTISRVRISHFLDQRR